MNNTVTISVNGIDYAGWKSVRVEAGLERVARSFELSVTDSWPGASAEVSRVNPGDLAEIRIGEDLVCTGYVDARPIDYDANGYTIVIRGRSKTADLVDCSADNSGGQFKGLLLEQVAIKIVEQYGLGVVVQTATGSAISDHQIQQGETAFESLDRLAKLRQILITDDEAGNVLLASVGAAGNATSGLGLGVNILSGSAGFDFSEVYSSYVVKGQKSGTDDSFGAAAAQISGTAVDSQVVRTRTLVVRQSGQADAANCAQRAAYEAQVRRAKAGEIRYRVAGWRQADGSLWRPNLFVQITDGLLGVNGALLISEVIYTLDMGGEICELVVIAPGAFATEPETIAKAKKRKGGSGRGSNFSWPDEVE